MAVLAPLATAALAVGADLALPVATERCGWPDVSTHCAAGSTVRRFVPSDPGVGVPSARPSTGLDIVVSGVPGQRYGAPFYGSYYYSRPVDAIRRI
jgi:hypothetical protein